MEEQLASRTGEQTQTDTSPLINRREFMKTALKTAKRVAVVLFALSGGCVPVWDKDNPMDVARRLKEEEDLRDFPYGTPSRSR